MVDALVSGTSGGNPVEVQVLSSAPNIQKGELLARLFCCPRFLIQPPPSLQCPLAPSEDQAPALSQK